MPDKSTAPTLTTPLTAFAARRARLAEVIGSGVAIIPTAPERLRNRDAAYPYRFDSYFWYLTGFAEPEAVLLLIGGSPAQSILFCRAKNAEREVWDGYRHGPEAAAQQFGFTAAYPISELATRLPGLLADRPALWHALGEDAAWDATVSAALNALRRDARSGKRAPHSVCDLRAVLDRMRREKDAGELELMRHAGAISAAGHARAMRACRPGMSEYQLEAELSYEFRRRGAAGHAYTPIVAGGSGACVLHYVDNHRRLPEDGLVLIDAGCEFAGYAADITRTFPVNGHFSAPQRDAYEIVLAAQEAAIAAVVPGAPFTAPHAAALNVLVQGMIDLKLLSGTRDGLIESAAYKRFYMHRTSHWLGLDVHDAGEYVEYLGETAPKAGGTPGDEAASPPPVKLAAGMVLTVEPGIYIAPAADVPPALAGIGIRIEDDVIVGSAGAEVYTAAAPKSVAAIEALMRSGREAG